MSSKISEPGRTVARTQGHNRRLWRRRHGVPEPTPEPCLWVLYGPGISWRLPLEVCWCGFDWSIARVRPHPGIPWLHCWMKVLAEAIAPSALPLKDTDRYEWWLSKESLVLIAGPCRDGVSPEDVVRWESPPRVNPLPPGEPLPAPQRDQASEERVRAFLEALVETVGFCGFESMEELSGFYHLLCQFMENWLATRTEPVDLVFTRLLASPLRPGWESDSYPSKIRNGKRVLRPDRKRQLVGLWSNSKHGALLGMETVRAKGGRRLRVHRYDVIALPNRRWVIENRRREEARLTLLGEYGYFKTSRERMDALWKHLEEAVARWLAARRTPGLAQFLALFENVRIRPRSGRIQHGKLKRNLAPGTIQALAAINARLKLAAAERAKLAGPKQPDYESPLAREAARLRKVSYIRWKEAQLRIARRKAANARRAREAGAEE